MPLDQRIQAFLNQGAGVPACPGRADAEDYRERETNELPLAAERLQIGAIRHHTIGTPAGNLSVYIYTPHGKGPFPVLVFFHGGGFVLGSHSTYDTLCRHLASVTGRIVVCPMYRLAPEHPFPAAVEDCHAALRWTADTIGQFGGETTQIAVAGDSAGGNLAAVISQFDGSNAQPIIRHQVLIYPMVDYYAEDIPSPYPSYQTNGSGYGLTRKDLACFWKHYVQDESQALTAAVSPIRARDLTGLPPALVITANFDPLRDEGEAYADRLHQSGVSVHSKRYDTMNHGYLRQWIDFEASRDALQTIKSFLASKP